MKQDTEYQKGRMGAMWFGGAVYVGVVIAATTLYISFVLSAFPEDAYFSRLVMSISGLLIGASMLAFPYALRTWAISGLHHTVTTVLYYIEMVIIAVNTIISFGSLLAKNTGYVMPEWAVLYEPFSIVAIVYTLAAWGTVFKLDPEGKRQAKRREFEEQYEDRIAEKTLEFLSTQEGHEAIEAAAVQDIGARINKMRNVRPSFHNGNGKLPVGIMRHPLELDTIGKEKPAAGDSFRNRA